MTITAPHSATRQRRQPLRTGHLFLLPSLLIMLVFVLFPIVQSAWMSLHDWSFFEAEHAFIGFQNYTELFGDPRFWNALRNTAVFTVTTVPLQIGLGLLLAVRLSRARWWTPFLRSAYFFPVVSSFATMAIVWKFLLSPDVGPTSAWLRDAGVAPPNILSSTALALPAVIMVGLWKNIGFTMVILIAALQDVPESLYEAAMIDGAGAPRRFFSVTVPSIRQALLFAVIMAIIASLQVFDQVYVMTDGGPLFHTETIVTYMYKMGFEQYRAGYASAIAWALFFLIMLASAVQLRLFRYRDVDN